MAEGEASFQNHGAGRVLAPHRWIRMMKRMFKFLKKFQAQAATGI